MDIKNLLEQLPIEHICGETRREITSVFCCDLLSLAMVKAPAQSCWVSVIANINSVAVAFHANIACLLIAEGTLPDQQTIEAAIAHNITLLRWHTSVFAAAKAVDNLLE